MNKKNDISGFAKVKAAGALAKAKAKEQSQATPPKERKRATPPWEAGGIVKDRKVNILVSVTEEERAILKYLKEKTGASINHSLKSVALPEARKKANKIFRGE